MKVKDLKKELNASSPEQLGLKLDELRRSLFMLRLSKKMSRAKDISQFKRLRRSVARVLTFMNR